MDQNADKLLRYMIDVDGLLDKHFIRRIVQSEFTEEFFEEYAPNRNEFSQTTQSMIYAFARSYFEEYGVPPTEDSLMHEMLVRSDLHTLRKAEVTKTLKSIRNFEINANEFPYVLDRVREVYLTAKAIQVMQNGMETIKLDPIRGVEIVQRGLADILARTVISDKVKERTLNLSQFSNYLLEELDTHGQLMSGGVRYPYPTFNARLGGMFGGELIVIAGDANAGKSFIGRDIAYAVGLGQCKRTVCADREMQPEQQGVRFLAHLTQIPQRKIRNKHMQSKAETALLFEALGQYADLQNPAPERMLFLPPLQCVNTNMIKREVEAQWGDERPECIIADYMNEFEPTRKAEGWEAMVRVLKDLRQLAIYFDCPVVTMAQTDEKGRMKYKSVKEICDTLLIISMNKDNPYIPPEADQLIGTPGIIDVWVEKARNEAKHFWMHLEVEFATASIREANLASNRTSQAILDRDQTPYDIQDVPDLEE